jgi:curved DNA-binding protein CbpA
MVDDRLERLDYYSLLGVTREVDEVALRAAFRKFARRYHPDRFAGKSEAKVTRATAIYRRGSEAFQTLLNPASRREYDRVLSRGTLRLTANQREGAARKEMLADREVSAVDKLAIRSPAAMAFYKKALAAIDAEDWLTAHAALQSAANQEPRNFVIEARLDQGEARLRRR